MEHLLYHFGGTARVLAVYASDVCQFRDIPNRPFAGRGYVSPYSILPHFIKLSSGALG